MRKPELDTLKYDHYIQRTPLRVNLLATLAFGFLVSLVWWWLWPSVTERFFPEWPDEYRRIGYGDCCRVFWLLYVSGAAVRSFVVGSSEVTREKLPDDVDTPAQRTSVWGW